MSTENIRTDIVEARVVTVTYDNVNEGGGISINGLNVEEEINRNKRDIKTVENKIDLHESDSTDRKHILPEEIESIRTTKNRIETAESQIEELDTKIENISKSIDKPEIQAHKISIVPKDDEQGSIMLNGVNLGEKVNSIAANTEEIKNRINAHTHDVGQVVRDENKIHLTPADVSKINSIDNKAEIRRVADLEATVEELANVVDTKADQSDISVLENKSITYEKAFGENKVSLDNIVFTKDVTLDGGRLIMRNNHIVLNNHCANIEGPESYINIKDAKVSNIVEVKGTGVEENMGDVTLERNGEWYSVWDHLTNKVKHITKEERDRWNAKTDRTIFVLADADEDGKPLVETPNTTYIYLVADPAAPEDSDFHYNKWAWVERKDIPEEYAWEKIGSPTLSIEPAVDEDIKDESVIENNVLKHNFTLNKAEEITETEEKVPASKTVAEYVSKELENYVSKSGDTMSGDLEMVALDGGAIPSINLNGGNLNVKKGGAIHVDADESELHTDIYNYVIETPAVTTHKLQPSENALNKINVVNASNEDTTPVTLSVSGNSRENVSVVDIVSAPGEYAEATIGSNIIIRSTSTGDNSGVYIGNENTSHTLTLNGKNLGNAITTNTTNISNLTVRVDALEANHFILVEELPDISTAVPNAIYLVPKEDEQERNIKDEFIAVEIEGIKVWEKIGDTKIDLSGYVTREEAEDNYVNITGDTMTGQLAFADTTVAAIQLPYDDGITESGHIVFGGNTSSKLECTDISSSAIRLNTANSDVENGMNVSVMTSTGLMLAVVTPSAEEEGIVTCTFMDNEGNIIASNSVSTDEVNVNTLNAYTSPEHIIYVNGNLFINKDEYDRDFALFTNIIEPSSGNKVFFTKYNAPIDVTVSGTSKTEENAPIVRITSDEDNADVVISGESVYGHIKNPHLHLTDDQIKVLNAAENGCFIYKPSEPDPLRPDEPYKGANPKLILKNNEDTGVREATLQLDYDIGSSVELRGKNNTYTAIISNGNHVGGNKLEINDNGVIIDSAYFGPATVERNARTTIMGDTAIGNSTTNYKFTVNGVDIKLDKKQLDTKNNDDYDTCGNANGAMCVIEPLSNVDGVTLKSLTFTTRLSGAETAPNGKKMALYCCNADEAPSPFKQNATGQNTKYELPTGWKYIGISKNSYTNMALNTKYKYEFDDIKIEKGMMIAISFTNFEDLTETQFAWSQFGMQGRVNKTPEDHKNTFYNNSLAAATYRKDGADYRYTINYTAEFVTDHTAKPIVDAETPILYDGSIYNITGDSITFIATDIHNQVAKSTIVFTPTVDVHINNVFTNPADKTICYEETLLQGKVSIIEITHLNANDTDYITATIMPNIK